MNSSILVVGKRGRREEKMSVTFAICDIDKNYDTGKSRM